MSEYQAVTNFRTSAEMFDAGYAIAFYNINSWCYEWRFREETFKTYSRQMTENRQPNVPVARIEWVRANAIVGKLREIAPYGLRDDPNLAGNVQGG